MQYGINRYLPIIFRAFGFPYPFLGNRKRHLLVATVIREFPSLRFVFIAILSVGKILCEPHGVSIF